MIDVVDEGVERPDALLEAGLQAHPFLRGQHPRHDIERDQPLGALLLAIDRERDADPMEQGVRLRALLGEALGGLGSEPFVIALVVQARGTTV